MNSNTYLHQARHQPARRGSSTIAVVLGAVSLLSASLMGSCVFCVGLGAALGETGGAVQNASPPQAASKPSAELGALRTEAGEPPAPTTPALQQVPSPTARESRIYDEYLCELFRHPDRPEEIVTRRVARRHGMTTRALGELHLKVLTHRSGNDLPMMGPCEG